MHAAREYEYRQKVSSLTSLPVPLGRVLPVIVLERWNCMRRKRRLGSAIARQCWPGQRRAADVDGIPARVECSPV
eukprot:3208749-Pleurochrysis_carterae.AAC.1